MEEIKTLTIALKQQLLMLWNQEYPSILHHADIISLDAYLNTLNEPLYTLILDESELKAWYVDFDRSGERWFAMIVSRMFQGKGYGKALLEQGKVKNKILNGWAIAKDDYQRSDGTIYPSPLGFYQKMGFQLLTSNILKTEQLEAIQIRWESYSKKNLQKTLII